MEYNWELNLRLFKSTQKPELIQLTPINSYLYAFIYSFCQPQYIQMIIFLI